MLFGLLEGYIIVYLILFFLVQPFFNLNISSQSNYVSPILNKTPFISGFANESLRDVNEVRDLSLSNDGGIDLKLVDIILKEKVTSKKVVEKLVDDGKLKIEGIKDILDKYN